MNELNVIHLVMQALENSTYIDPSVTQSWLRDFLDYLKRNEGYSDVSLPVGSPKDFAQTLKNIYLADPSNPAKLDVAFNENNTQVVAARFLIQVGNRPFIFNQQGQFCKCEASRLTNSMVGRLIGHREF